MLIRPDVTDEQTTDIEKQIGAIVTDSSGSVLSFEKWGRLRLSYPIRRNEHGVYILTRYEFPEKFSSKISEQLKTFFRIKVHDIVLRNVCKRLDKDASLSYLRPETDFDSVKDMRVGQLKEETETQEA